MRKLIIILTALVIVLSAGAVFSSNLSLRLHLFFNIGTGGAGPAASEFVFKDTGNLAFKDTGGIAFVDY